MHEIHSRGLALAALLRPEVHPVRPGGRAAVRLSSLIGILHFHYDRWSLVDKDNYSTPPKLRDQL